MAPQAAKRRARIGRPPAGARVGEKVKDYPQLSIRLPIEVKAKLRALSAVASRPQWRIVTDAIDCYIQARTRAERRTIEGLARRSTTRAPRAKRGR